MVWKGTVEVEEIRTDISAKPNLLTKRGAEVKKKWGLFFDEGNQIAGERECHAQPTGECAVAKQPVHRTENIANSTSPVNEKVGGNRLP